MDKLVEVIDLSFRYGGRSEPLLCGVGLDLYAGEIALVAGATGSGKSTLLACLAGIAPAYTGGQLSGQIRYLQSSLLGLGVRARARYLGTVMQNVEVQIFTDRVREELVFGLENLNLPPKQIEAFTDRALCDFGLAAQGDWPVARLSAGQKQRLVLACVLAMDQPVLLLDEPFAYLDRAGACLLVQLLKRQAEQGQAVLVVEHRIDLLRSVVDRPYRLVGGKLAAGWPAAVARLSPPSVALPLDAPVRLRARGLSYGGYPLLPDLELRAGQAILLQGDNGCGKTTLLRLLSGLLKPATGSLEIGGADARRLSAARIARTVGFVLQNPNHQLFAEGVRREVLQPGVSPEWADALIAQLDLAAEGERHPQALSQGQKRRLALAAVLARRPLICLLDEITVGQDPGSLELMFESLERFVATGGGLILTSHDPQVAARLGATIVALA